MHVYLELNTSYRQGSQLKLGMEYSSNFIDGCCPPWHELCTHTLQNSCGPSSACNVELELFTVLRSSILPSPMSNKSTSTTNGISLCPITSLGSNISKEVLAQDIPSGSSFCSIYGPLALWESKKTKPKQVLAYLKKRPIILQNFNIHPGKQSPSKTRGWK